MITITDEKSINNEKMSKAPENKSYAYLDLLYDNAPEISSDYYEDAEILNKQIENPNVNNIAIVAKYGAGKSSVINTYLSIYRDYVNKARKKDRVDGKQWHHKKSNKKDYVRVSLGTFMGANYDELSIERSILQQLLYSRNKNQLPNSKIERTNRTSSKRTLLYSFVFTVFVFATVLFGIALGTANLFVDWLKYVLLGLSVVSLFILIFGLLYYRKLRKIKYKDLEADFQDDKDKPLYVANLINKFVDEVLYFFECIDVDLVIFEDLDRLPNTEIFAKLRELNTIINASGKRADKVTFLYAIKDGLFKTEEERAKFFEFILPVVPVINPVTTKAAIDKIIGKIKDENPNMVMTDRFLKAISSYIPDMRILKNTFNDYIMMYHKIFEKEGASKFLKTEKLFALCLYKNLYPYDYALLEKNEGLIPLIVDMQRLRVNGLAEIDKKLQELKNRMSELQAESLHSFEELKAMFIGQVVQLPYSNSSGDIDIKNISTFEGLDFNNIKHPVPDLRYSYLSWKGVELPRNQTELLTPGGERYIDKENAIKEKEAAGIDKIKKQIADLEVQKQNISVWTLKDVTDNLGIDNCFPDDIKSRYMKSLKLILSDENQLFLDSIVSVKKISEEVADEIKRAYKEYKSTGLSDETFEKQLLFLRFLVSQNYIDEHYIEYTSNYKASILSTSDISIVQSIQRFQSVEFNSKIENLEEFILWLDEDDFSHVFVLIKPILTNINLVHQLSQRDNNDKKYKNLITLLKNTDNNTVLDKISKFIETSVAEDCYNFLRIIIPIRPTLCSEILKADILSTDKKDLILTAEIKFAVNYTKEDDIVRDYISRHNSYMKIFDGVGNTDKVIRFLTEVSPVFVRMQYLELYSNIQQEIINNHRYVLSLHNLQVIFDIDDIAEDYSYFYNKNYDTIIHSNKKPVISYIENNIETYVRDILLNDKISCDDEPIENLIELLNNDKISIAVRRELISKIHAVFEDVTQFPTELYTDLLSNGNIVATWANVEIVYEYSGFDGIITFLEHNDKIEGTFVDLPGIKKETPAALIKDILMKLSEEKVNLISNTLPAEIILSGMTLDGVSDENLAAFIKNRRVSYANEDLIHLYTRPKSLTQYLKVHKDSVLKNFDVFFEKALPVVYSAQDHRAKSNAQDIIAAVIGCMDIDVNFKRQLINKCEKIIKIIGHDIIYATYILSEKAVVPAKILWQFTNSNINTSDKIAILGICNYGADINGNIDLNQIRAYLISCGEPYALLYQDNKKVYMEKTEQNEQFLKVLKNTGIVKSYKKVRNHEEYEIQVK